MLVRTHAYLHPILSFPSSLAIPLACRCQSVSLSVCHIYIHSKVKVKETTETFFVLFFQVKKIAKACMYVHGKVETQPHRFAAHAPVPPTRLCRPLAYTTCQLQTRRHGPGLLPRYMIGELQGAWTVVRVVRVVKMSH